MLTRTTPDTCRTRWAKSSNRGFFGAAGSFKSSKMSSPLNVARLSRNSCESLPSRARRLLVMNWVRKCALVTQMSAMVPRLQIANQSLKLNVRRTISSDLSDRLGSRAALGANIISRARRSTRSCQDRRLITPARNASICGNTRYSLARKALRGMTADAGDDDGTPRMILLQRNARASAYRHVSTFIS